MRKSEGWQGEGWEGWVLVYEMPEIKFRKWYIIGKENTKMTTIWDRVQEKGNRKRNEGGQGMQNVYFTQRVSKHNDTNDQQYRKYEK